MRRPGVATLLVGLLALVVVSFVSSTERPDEPLRFEIRLSEGAASAIADLGLDATAVGDTITGRRLLGGLRTVLLDSLDGGAGIGPLGDLEITDRDGGSATVDLSSAETIDDVLKAINAEAAVDVTAQLNAARNGVELIDTSGGSGNLVVASGDATDTAELLNLAVDDAVSQVGSGDLHLQVISQNTTLASLNGGSGIARDRDLAKGRSGGPVRVNTSPTEGLVLDDHPALHGRRGILDRANSTSAITGRVSSKKQDSQSCFRERENHVKKNGFRVGLSGDLRFRRCGPRREH